MVKKVVLWALVILCMALIFSFSAQGADDSMDLSDGLLYDILNFLHIELSLEVVTFLRVFIRKVAHFSIYMLLGVLSYMLFKVGYEKREKFSALYAILMCAAYAITDEVHQIFVPGRSGMIRDVLIDSAGAMCGIVLAGLVCWIITCRRRKNG